MDKGIAIFIVVGILVLGIWAYYSGTQLETCVYVVHTIICGNGWGVLAPLL